MIDIDQVTFTHHGARRPTLHAVDLHVPEGDLTVVVGRTGCGKSTLLQAIPGLVPHFTGGRFTGAVRVAGVDITSARPRDASHLVGFVGQDPAAGFVANTVEAEIAFGMEQLGHLAPAMRRRVEETLDLLGIADLRDRGVRTLSGGQQQRVAIAAVLAAQPRVLVLDEPTSALDPTAAHDVLAALTTLVHELGLTVVVAEHRLERVVHAADALAWLPGDGSVDIGPPRDVLARCDVRPPLVDLAAALDWPDAPLSVREARRRVTAAGGAASLLDVQAVPRLADADPAFARAARADGPSPVAPGDARPGITTTPSHARLRAWWRTHRHPTAANHLHPSAALAAQGLRVEHDGTPVVHGVDITLTRGEITAVMGRNGAGKSTLLRTLQGAQTRTGGTLSVRVSTTPTARPRLGEEEPTPAALDPLALDARSARTLVTLVPQTPADLLYLPTVAAELTRSDRDAGAPAGTSGALACRLGLDVEPERHPRDLSEGQRLLLVLAIQLVPGPGVVLLDEPTRGLDYPSKHRLVEILTELARAGTAVLVATHDVEFAAACSHRTILLADGDVVAAGDSRTVCTASPAFAPQTAKVFAPLGVLTPADVRATRRHPTSATQGRTP